MTVYEKTTGDRYEVYDIVKNNDEHPMFLVYMSNGWLYRKAELFVPNISDLVGHPYMCAISKYGEDGKNGT